MFGIGGTELIVILVVALLVLGPKKLPELAKTLGKAMGEFRRFSTDFQRTLNTEIALDEEKAKAEKLNPDAVTTPQKTQNKDVKMEEVYKNSESEKNEHS